MAGTVNRVHLIGRLGQDPEMRVGRAPLRLSIATDETWRDKQTGERKQATTWHTVVVFNERCADFAERYLKKGALVWILGKLGNRRWTDNSGVTRYATEVVVDQFGGDLQSLQSTGGGYRAPQGREEYGMRPDDREPGDDGDMFADDRPPPGGHERPANGGPGEYFKGDPNKPPRTTMDNVTTRFDTREGDEIPF